MARGGAKATKRRRLALAGLPILVAQAAFAQDFVPTPQAKSPSVQARARQARGPQRLTTSLPAIRVIAAQHSKRKPPAHARVPEHASSPSAIENSVANVAAGATVAPTMANQMTVSGADLNARAVT